MYLQVRGGRVRFVFVRLSKPEGFVCVARKLPEFAVVCVLPSSRGDTGGRDQT